MGDAAGAWICASCGRQVPGRVTTCRCGNEAPATLQFDESRTATAEKPSSIFGAAVVAFVVIAAIGIAYVLQSAATPDHVAGNPPDATGTAEPADSRTRDAANV